MGVGGHGPLRLGQPDQVQQLGQPRLVDSVGHEPELLADGEDGVQGRPRVLIDQRGPRPEGSVDCHRCAIEGHCAIDLGR